MQDREPGLSGDPDLVRLFIQGPKDNFSETPSYIAWESNPSYQGTGMAGPTREEMDAKMAGLHSDVRADFADLKASFADVRADISGQLGDIKGELAKKPGMGALITTAIAIVGLILGALAFASNTFNGGLSLAPMMQNQVARDAEQDRSVQDINAKLDRIAAALEARPTETASPAPTKR